MSGLAELGVSAVKGIERQDLLTPFQQGLERAVASVLGAAGRTVRNVLYGTGSGIRCTGADGRSDRGVDRCGVPRRGRCARPVAAARAQPSGRS
jgi:hypothetical protein